MVHSPYLLHFDLIQSVNSSKGIYISNLHERSVEEDFLILILGKAIPVHTVSKSSISDCLLEVDVERAWNKMGLSNWYGNELEMQVYMYDGINSDTDQLVVDSYSGLL